MAARDGTISRLRASRRNFLKNKTSVGIQPTGGSNSARKGGDLAPDMLLNESYKASVDVYALGLVIAGLLTSGFSPTIQSR